MGAYADRMVCNPQALKGVLGVILLALLSACAGGVQSVPVDYDISDQSEKGLLVGSLTYDGGYSGYSIMFQGKNDERRQRIQTGKGLVLIPYFPDGDFGAIGLKGDVFAVELPEGEYWVSSWNISSGLVTVKPTGTFQIDFVIKAGEILYLGNFNFKQTSKFGLTVTGADATYSDQFERDMALLRTKYRNIPPGTVHKGIKDGFVLEKLGGDPNMTWSQPAIYIPVY